ncbi:rod shape-determining protein MreD [Leptospira hartskeerlii]|uniref:Rod shape-determining protein MreD n=8 Tax=Leptospira TaxID=171 RepID=A0A4R9G0G3_9LEPT|nr:MULTISPECIES: rod shape-determining protein MreD [Leptospira]PJZ24034.1 rod shape-determining protein MreD [Leptospira hartskeerlii]PJZ32100.1 rod shape-determining protein MreD [Leptospira hartskeerlii]PJZ47728.1 rod shape-determining protein MreD [Leptospira saintgironsiae]PJZ75427.1 rod shape-determining protein MreD [Leptospira neocaledonica]PKA14837.1 rod shape-determining protein MreD [Leptospira haakeii]
MILEYIVIGAGILISHFLNGTNLFEISGFKPDFMVIFVLFFALRRGTMAGIWIGFFGGLLSDSGLGGEIVGNVVTYKIGLHSLTFCIMGYIVGKFARPAYHENQISIMLYSLVVTLISRIASYFLFSLFFHENLNYSIISTSIFNGAIAPIFFWVLGKLYRLEQAEG